MRGRIFGYYLKHLLEGVVEHLNVEEVEVAKLALFGCIDVVNDESILLRLVQRYELVVKVPIGPLGDDQVDD